MTTAVRDFLILTNLARGDEIVEENPPTDGSRRAVDLTALDTFIEFKRRIGTTGGFNPDQANVKQLDDYLELSKTAGKGVRTGILTDGKYWLLRWPEAGTVRTMPPYGFVLEAGDKWLLLYEWLRDCALMSLESVTADCDNVEKYLGPGSPAYQRDVDTLAALYSKAAQYETVKVKRRLWENLLRAALGEIAQAPEELDHLFIRHTYLSLAIINSDALYEAVQPLMAKGQFGARHPQKHLWKLPIPEYDAAIPLHREIAEAGAAAARGAATRLAALRSQRGGSCGPGCVGPPRGRRWRGW